ncbi:MAG: ribulose 1,5-bisphosphate carboxylase large subunit [Candidatus Thermoplasmatota archaeon]|nr:ribulose 1,5-bisphosphate carboxylase large subunit [Candidatus Thermoplasmatota archaeon]MBS3789312.1 ribulose 1,5-bisphosphate carboxylase large subunit [Candidatus Thermoplasmatota archaeon]
MSIDYLALDEELDQEDYIICEYTVKSDLNIKTAGKRIAEEESTGTWTHPTTLSEDIFKNYGAKVTKAQGNRVRIGYPVIDFSGDIGGIPQILSIIAGNLFGLESLEGVRLVQLELPSEIVKQYPGPQFGITRLRNILDRPEKPLVGTIVKPKIGLPPKEFADYVYQAGRGGLTNSKDDETLVDQDFCPLEERVSEVSEKLDILEEEGYKMIHAHNISTTSHKILEAADLALENGARQLMIDVLTVGFSGLQALAEDPSVDVPIHVHRAMHGAITKNPHHGISMSVISKIVRMAGGDALHIGTYGTGKMHAEVDEELKCKETLLGDMHGLPKLMPVASGGLHPGLVPELIKMSGMEVQIQAGGGVSGHPDGVRSGAKALRQAVDAVSEGVDLKEYAEKHRELRKALEKWM